MWGLRCGGDVAASYRIEPVEGIMDTVRVTLAVILCVRDRIYIKTQYNSASS